ncbi:hypothetical protein [Lentzea sp. NPDC003310]|uniref:hypothetical protein n=1 Tax=Lentzea sp. NPDC003310 TaxID=3154447 RepID=UPI0033BA671E
MSVGQRRKRFFVERVLTLALYSGITLFTALVLWLRTTFWVAFAWWVGGHLLLFAGIAYVELRDRWRARRGRAG